MTAHPNSNSLPTVFAFHRSSRVQSLLCTGEPFGRLSKKENKRLTLLALHRWDQPMGGFQGVPRESRVRLDRERLCIVLQAL